jgi:hypothetical protein
MKASPILTEQLRVLRDYALDTAELQGLWPLAAADDWLRMKSGDLTILFREQEDGAGGEIFVMDGDLEFVLAADWRYRTCEQISVFHFRPGAWETMIAAALPNHETVH